MKFYCSMPAGLKVYFNDEVKSYGQQMKIGNLPAAWRHLERAHVLGQSWPREHNYSHWLMLKFGIKIKDRREIIGQIPRLLVGGVKSFVGKIPVGNTGGANVPPLRPMEIPKDLALVLDRYKKP